MEADGDVCEEGVDRHEGEGAGVGEGVAEGRLQISYPPNVSRTTSQRQQIITTNKQGLIDV